MEDNYKKLKPWALESCSANKYFSNDFLGEKITETRYQFLPPILFRENDGDY